MSDERIDEQIDVIAKELDRRQGYDPNHPEDARLALAALRDAGFDVVDLGELRSAIDDYGPNPIHHAKVMERHRQEWPTLWRAIYRLIDGVPVGDDSCAECGRPYGEHQPECPPVVPVRDDCEPQLGCATTRQLIEELTARIDVLGQLDYSTVDGTPTSGLVPVGGDS